MTVTCDKCNKILSTAQTLKKHKESKICERNAKKKSVERNQKDKKSLVRDTLKEQAWNFYIGEKVENVHCPYCLTNKMSRFAFDIRYSHRGYIRPLCVECSENMKGNDLDIVKWEFGHDIDIDGLILKAREFVKETMKVIDKEVIQEMEEERLRRIEI